MGKKYVKCPRCELNYILEDEDYCHVCKSEMKHHTEADDELLDLEDMELCPVCGQNYIKEDQTMCDECRGRSKSSKDSDSSLKDWKEEDESEDSRVSAESDIDGDEEYNSGFSDIDPENDELDPYKTEEDDDLLEVGDDIDFALDEEEPEEDEIVETMKDDFESVEVSDDDDDDDDDEDDDDYDFDDDMLGKKK